MPITEVTPRLVNQFALVRGVEFTLRTRPGAFRVVRESVRTPGGRELFRGREVLDGDHAGPIRWFHWSEVESVLADGLDSQGFPKKD